MKKKVLSEKQIRDLLKIAYLGASSVVCLNIDSPKAYAVCTDIDVSSQIALVAASQPQPNQNNDAEGYMEDSCFGNTATTFNSQLYVGNGTVNQNRERNVYQGGSVDPLQGIVDTPNFKFHINHQQTVPVPLELIP
jgi:hypothetical protein